MKPWGRAEEVAAANIAITLILEVDVTEKDTIAAFASQTIADIEKLTPFLDTTFLDSISETHSCKTWQVQIKLSHTNIPFKEDTGAEATAISDETFSQKLKHYHKLKKPTRTMLGPSRKPLEVIGRFNGVFQHKHTKTT